MRFLANENFPLVVVEALRRSGHDTAWVLVDAAGSSDEAVLARALREERVLLTFDKDFGALVFQRGATASCGILLFRMQPMAPEDLASWVVSSLAVRTDWRGHFAVVESGRVRLRRLSPKRHR